MFRLMPFKAPTSALIGGFGVYMCMCISGQSPRLCFWCHVHVMSCITHDELILHKEGCWAGNIQPAHGDLGSPMAAWERPVPMARGCCQNSKEKNTKQVNLFCLLFFKPPKNLKKHEAGIPFFFLLFV